MYFSKNFLSGLFAPQLRYGLRLIILAVQQHNSGYSLGQALPQSKYPHSKLLFLFTFFILLFRATFFL